MIFLLLIVGVVPPIIAVIRSRRLTHDVFFSLGYIYYWILPVLVGEFPLSIAQKDRAYQSWAGIFASLPQGKLVVYAVSIALYYWCFRFGDMMATKTTRKTRFSLNPNLSFLSPLYWATFLLAIVYTYHIRWAIGMNYVDTGDVIIAKGTLTAISLLQFGLALMLSLKNRRSTFLSTITNRWMFGYFLIATALFAMGQRLHFITSLLLLVAFRSVYFRSYTRAQLLLSGLALAGVGGLAGLVRLGTSVSVNGLLMNLTFEPVFTSFSLVSFLQANHLPLLELPRFLAGDFLNLVPTAILPNKPDLLPDPIKAGFWFTSPLGAMNSWVSFVINFGLIGTGFVMAFVGYGLRWLHLRADSPLVRTQYLMCSAFMVFTFFRDPFSVSLVKNIFEFSLVMPLVCALLSTWIAWSTGASFGTGAASARAPVAQG